MKKTILLFLFSLILAMGIGFGVNAEDQETTEFEAPEDGLEINFIQGNSDRDLAVEFNHSSHEGYSCQDCHHKMYQQKGNKPPRSCSECHDKFGPDDLKGYKSYFKAMHKIRFDPQAPRPSCLDCHVREFGEDDTDMTGCLNSACHSDGIN